MPLSAKALHASGRISDKQMAKLQVLRGTRSQPSKMAAFDGRSKDEGRLGNRGVPEMCDDEINNRGVQDKGGGFGKGGKRSPPSMGGRAGPEGQLNVKHIDKPSMQRPKFPRGGDVSSRNPKTGNTRMLGGRKQRSGNMYDEPGRNGFR